jgi:hypothetical protein
MSFAIVMDFGTVLLLSYITRKSKAIPYTDNKGMLFVISETLSYAC